MHRYAFCLSYYFLNRPARPTWDAIHAQSACLPPSVPVIIEDRFTQERPNVLLVGTSVAALWTALQIRALNPSATLLVVDTESQPENDELVFVDDAVLKDCVPHPRILQFVRYSVLILPCLSLTHA